MELQKYRAIPVNPPHVVQTQFAKSKKDTQCVRVPQTTLEVRLIVGRNVL